MYKGKISIKEMMEMTNQDFYALYHAAWKLSMKKAKEAEEQAKLEAQEAKAAKNNNKRPVSNIQRMQAALSGIRQSDFQEMIEELE